MCDFLLCVLPYIIYMFYLMYSYAIVFVLMNCRNKSESESFIAFQVPLYDDGRSVQKGAYGLHNLIMFTSAYSRHGDGSGRGALLPALELACL